VAVAASRLMFEAAGIEDLHSRSLARRHKRCWRGFRRREKPVLETRCLAQSRPSALFWLTGRMSPIGGD